MTPRLFARTALLALLLCARAWSADDATRPAPTAVAATAPATAPATGATAPALVVFNVTITATAPATAPDLSATAPAAAAADQTVADPQDAYRLRWLLPPPRPPAEPPPPAALTATVSNQEALPHTWKHTITLGAHVNAVTASHHASQSPDPTIEGTTNSEAYLFTGDATVGWAGDGQSADQTVSLHYGRQRVENQAWLMNDNLIHYDAVVREDLSRHGFLYFSDGLDSVFQGPGGESHPFDPMKVHAGGGYGQRYVDLFALADAKDTLEWRLGARLQKAWSRAFDHDQREIEYGPESFARYDFAIGDRETLFIQNEAFLDAADPAHVSDLITAGLTMRPLPHLSADLGLRAYYETRPKDIDPATNLQYDHWGLRTNAHIGIIVAF
jgi:hypothetical protein